MTCHLQPKGRATRTSAGGSRVTSLQFMAAAVLAVGVGCGGGNRGYQVGGHVSGLSVGNEITLVNNSGDVTIVTANGAFAFNSPVASGASYNVTIGTQPSGQACIVNQGTGSGR